MGLLLLEDFQLATVVEVKLSDRVYSDTTKIKRKAFVGMRFHPFEPFPSVELTIIVKKYVHLADGIDDISYGDYLGGLQGYQDVTYYIIADNKTVVDVDNNGAYLGTASDLIINWETREIDPSIADKNVMREFDFYRMVARNQLVKIEDLLVHKTLWADAEGKLG